MHGDRVAMERELDVHERRLLYETCRLAGVDRHCWHVTPAIARGWEMLCHGRLSTRLQDDGVRRTTADAIAAARLGLDSQTIESRRRQWQQGADRRNNVMRSDPQGRATLTSQPAGRIWQFQFMEAV